MSGRGAGRSHAPRPAPRGRCPAARRSAAKACDRSRSSGAVAPDASAISAVASASRARTRSSPTPGDHEAFEPLGLRGTPAAAGCSAPIEKPTASPARRRKGVDERVRVRSAYAAGSCGFGASPWPRRSTPITVPPGVLQQRADPGGHPRPANDEPQPCTKRTGRSLTASRSWPLGPLARPCRPLSGWLAHPEGRTGQATAQKTRPP